jgi:hypothetical protein
VWVWLGTGLWRSAVVRGGLIIDRGQRHVPISLPHGISTAVPVERVEPRDPQSQRRGQSPHALPVSELRETLGQLGYPNPPIVAR